MGKSGRSVTGRGPLTSHLLLALALASSVHAQAHQIRSDWITQDNEYVMTFVNVTYHNPVSSELNYHSGEIGKYSNGLVAVAAGRLVHVRAANGSSHDGCDWPWEPVAPADEPWVALVTYGRCTPDVKLENALRANASALVVYDNQPRGLLQRLHLDSERRDSLVTVFFRKQQGEDLADLVDRGFDIWMQLTPGRRVTFSVEKLNRTSVLFVSMSFILLLVISLAWLLFYYVQRFRYMHAKDRLARHLVSAARKALSRVPLRTLKVDDEQLGDAECCAVCLESYRAAECVRMLPCSHQFHMVCVDPWLLKNRSCPMCKMDILKYYGMTVVTGEEGLPQLGSPGEPTSPEPVPVSMGSGRSSPHQADRRSQTAPSMPPSLVRIAVPPGGAEGSTCAGAGGSTCAAGSANSCESQMALQCAKLSDVSSSCPSMSGTPSAAYDCSESVDSPLNLDSALERRLSLPDDDSSLSESAATFQSCHPASCESLSCGSPDVSPGAGRPEPPTADAMVVVHMNEMDT
ncbi:protein goliath-like [Amphibalanus amphitrite]|uniref:protein goliath-like n=1 Tax=Amphibalanus amphitrite TaxID=1232801 RepID=UPI001C903689|nr:protein goliath-like [Amphibalanus amphitrite]